MKRCLSIAIFVIATISLFNMPSKASAGIIFGRRLGGCGVSVGNCSTCTTCAAPAVVVQEVAVPVLAYPVLVPAYQFQYVPQAYAAVPTVPVVPVTGYPVATPVVQPVAPMNYGQPLQPYQQPPQPQPQPNLNLTSKDKIRELVREILLEELNKEAAGGDNGPPPVPGTQSVAPPTPPAPNNPNAQPLQQLALTSMGRTCAQCHTGVGSRKDTILFTQPGVLNQNINWKRVKDEVSNGRMPPKDAHFQLSLQERQYIVQWLNSIGVN